MSGCAANISRQGDCFPVRPENPFRVEPERVQNRAADCKARVPLAALAIAREAIVFRL